MSKKQPGVRYKISGRVLHGDKYGQRLGYPTANLDRRQFSRMKQKPKNGVWSGWAEIVASAKQQAPRKYKSGIIIGPVGKKGLPKIEAHLLKFRGNLYGKKIILSLSEYLRPFKKFASEQELKLQIMKDLDQAAKLNY